VYAFAIIKLLPHVKKKVPSNQNGHKCLQVKDSCGIGLQQHLENEAIEKVSVKVNIPQA